MWYLIVLLNEHGNVLVFDLVKSRKKEVIAGLIERAERRMGKKAEIIITDDFLTYKGVVMMLKRDLIHVKHIHKPPHGRMVIDKFEWKEKEVHITHMATTNDILVNSNTFIVRVSHSTTKLHKKGKRGHPRGSKNRPRTRIKKKLRAAEQPEEKKKRGPKDPFKDVETHAFHYDAKRNVIRPIGRNRGRLRARTTSVVQIKTRDDQSRRKYIFRA